MAVNWNWVDDFNISTVIKPILLRRVCHRRACSLLAKVVFCNLVAFNNQEIDMYGLYQLYAHVLEVNVKKVYEKV